MKQIKTAHNTFYFRNTSPARMSQPIKIHNPDTRKLFQLKKNRKSQMCWQSENKEQQSKCQKRYCKSFYMSPRVSYQYSLQKKPIYFDKRPQDKEIGEETHEDQKVKLQNLPHLKSMSPKVNQYLYLLLRKNNTSTNQSSKDKMPKSNTKVEQIRDSGEAVKKKGHKRYNSFMKQMKIGEQNKRIRQMFNSEKESEFVENY